MNSRVPGRARRRARPADVAFAAAACIVLAGYNNLVGLRPWHRRWYPVINGCAAVAAIPCLRLRAAPLKMWVTFR